MAITTRSYGRLDYDRSRSMSPGMVFSSNICKECGKSRNIGNHQRCSKIRQKKYKNEQR